MEPSLVFMAVFLTLGSNPTPVNAEIHFLHYIYTVISKPINRPGIHEFTAMGVLDGSVIDYFDSDTQEKVARQNWMEMNLDKHYWDKGTQSRRSKQQWFKVNINILMNRFRQNDSDTHVLQWMHGCNVDIPENESKQPNFLHGIDMYSYNGENFLSFNEDQENWDAPNSAGIETKTKWDKVPVLTEYTKAYLKKECVTWLTKFLKYQKENGTTAKPHMYVFSTGARVQTNTVLRCMATGFSSTNILVQIKRDNRVLTREDGVQSSDILPNGDGTFQKTDYVEIPNNDKSIYTCELIHAPSGLHLVKVWDEKPAGETRTVLLVASICVFVLICGVLQIVLIKKFCISKCPVLLGRKLASSSIQNNSLDNTVQAPSSLATKLLQNKSASSSQDSGISSKDGSCPHKEDMKCEEKLCEGNLIC